MPKFILAIDQGTTSSRSIIYDDTASVVETAQKEFRQIYPQLGWVEHDPELIWKSQLETVHSVIASSGISVLDIAAVGITNQRETTVVWNRKTGKPIYNAIVWQDRRTAKYCDELTQKGYQDLIQNKTGLVIDAYFSATKIKWVLDNVKGARQQAENGELAFGTIDTWLIWKLTNGKTHITDVSNASRTMLYNIRTLKWDEELLDLFEIPKSILPEVVDSSGNLAMTDKSVLGVEIAISGIAGDQQAALFGQLCVKPGMAKSTYGTGCFLMLNTGNTIVKSNHKLLSTIGWKIGDEVSYALEGSVFIGGAVIQWLRDEMEFFVEASDSEALAEASSDNGGVYFVPALTGLGAPHWDANARGSIFGITRGTTKAHLTRAALESICFQVNDLLKCMDQDTELPISTLRVDGGAAGNHLLLQFQSDISGIKVHRPVTLESTSLGVTFLAGLGIGLWDMDFITNHWQMDEEFNPVQEKEVVAHLLSQWDEAVKRTIGWHE